jgi:hypothetical protein
MKKTVLICSRWTGCLSTTLLLIILSVVLSCQKISPVDKFLGDYYTERFNCTDGGELLDAFSSSTIERPLNNNTSEIEIHFVSTRKAIWYGYIKADSLIFPKQIVFTTNIEYFKGGIEIKGFGVFRNGTIDFEVEEHYLSSGYKHTCTFSAKKK